MIKYTLNNETFDVPLKDEEQFKIDNPDAVKVEETPEDYDPASRDEYEYTPATKEVVEEEEEVIEDPITPIIETDLSQDNQEYNISDYDLSQFQGYDELGNPIYQWSKVDSENKNIVQNKNLEEESTKTKNLLQPNWVSELMYDNEGNIIPPEEREDSTKLYNWDLENEEFWARDGNDMVESLDALFGGDQGAFSYSVIQNPIAKNQNVKVTHKESGNSVMLDANIDLEILKTKNPASNAAVIKDPETGLVMVNTGIMNIGSQGNLIMDLFSSTEDKQEAKNNYTQSNALKLHEFLNENLSEKEKGFIKENQNVLVQKFKLNESKWELTKKERKELDDLVNNPNLFDPVITTWQDDSGETKTSKTQPYEKELKKAKEMFQDEGIKDPTQEQIHKVAKDIIEWDEKSALYQQNIIDYMNSNEVEGETLKWLFNQEYGGTMGEVQIGAQLSSEIDKKELIKHDIILKNLKTTYENGNATKKYNNYINIFGNKDFDEFFDNKDITADEVYAEAGAIIDQKTYNQREQKIIDDNPIMVNGEIIQPGQEGFDAGALKISKKYSFPTEDEQTAKFKSLQSKVKSGEISVYEGESLWNTYVKKFDEDQKELLEELKVYDAEYAKQVDNQNELLNQFQSDQKIKMQKADARINLINEEADEYIQLENGKKIPKKMWEDFESVCSVVEHQFSEIEDYLDQNLELIADLEDTPFKNALIQKNHNDWDKFTFNIGSSINRMKVGSIHAVLKLVNVVTMTDDTDFGRMVDNAKYNMDRTNQILKDEFQPDIEFDDAFKSSSNFGKFLTQEIGTQLPTQLAIYFGGWAGIGGVTLSSFSDNWSRMVAEEIENPGVHHTTSNKFWTSGGYAAAELTDAMISKYLMKKSWKGGSAVWTGGSVWNTVKEVVKKRMLPGLIYVPAADVASEGFTQISQNWVTGNPEGMWADVDHAMFSGGMFSTFFSGGPTIKGIATTRFSDPKSTRQYRKNLDKILWYQTELHEHGDGLSPETKKQLEEQVAELQGENETILDNEVSKLDNMSEESAGTFLWHLKNQSILTNEYNTVKADKTLSKGARKEALQRITDKYNNNEVILNVLRTDPAFGERFNGFIASNKKEDIDRRTELFKQAKDELIANGKIEPNESQIKQKARILYNTQEIVADLINAKNNGLAKNFKSYNTVDEAIEAIDKMNISDTKKAELKENVKKGAHGATVFTKDSKGNEIKTPFQVVENMAKDGRLETRTHEKGHYILEELFKENPTAFNDISDQIFQHLLNNDLGSYILLKQRTKSMNKEEVITNFMELVADKEGINIKSKQNKKLPAFLGWMFNNVLSKKTNGNVKFNFEGETDAVTFITELAKKIKNGTIKLADIKAGKKSEVVSKYEAFKAEQKKGYKLSNPAEVLNELVPKSANTKAKFKKWIKSKDGSEAVADEIYSENGAIYRAVLKNANYNEDQANKTIGKIVSRIWGKTGFNPEAIRADGSKVGAKAFGEFVMAGYGKDRIGTIKDLYKEGKLGPKRDVSGDLVIGESGRTIFEKSEAEGDLSPEELLILKQETAAQKRKTQETLDDLLKLDDKLKQEFVNSLKLAFGTKLPEIATTYKEAKLFEAELLKIITDKLRIKIQKKFGTELAYNEFIKNDLLPLLKFIKIDDLVQMERNVGGKTFPGGRKLFGERNRLTNKKAIQAEQNKGNIPITFSNYNQGYWLKTRYPDPTGVELKAFFRGIDALKILGYQPPSSIESGVLGARKDRLAELMTREIAKDYAMKVIRLPEVIKRITDIEALQDRIIKDSYISEVGAILNRDPDAGSINTDNSSVKFSRQSKEVILEQVDLMDVLIKEFGGIENVIDKDGNFLLIGPNENISALAIATAIEMNDAGILEQAEVTYFKQGVQKLKGVPQTIKDDFKAVGNLSYATAKNQWNLDKLQTDMRYLAVNRFGASVINKIGYEIIGYKNKILNAPEKQIDKIASAIANKTIYKKDKNNNYIPGEYYEGKQVTIKQVNNAKQIKLPKNLVLDDVELYNKNKPLFKGIIKTQNKSGKRKLKIEEYKKNYMSRVNKANVANILLVKHIYKSIVLAVRNNEISPISGLFFLQMQTSIVNGTRGLSRLDLIEFLDGSQAISESHPDFKEALVYYKNKGIKINKGQTLESTVLKIKMPQKGEHVGAMNNTSLNVVPLFFNNANIDTELDLILNAHSQFLTSVYKTNILDDIPGGPASTAEFTRINALKESDIANIIGPNGESFQDVRKERVLNKLEKELVRNASIKYSKSISIYNAKDNLIKFSKKPKTQGASIFDFDDTLGFTKSGVRYTQPNPSGKPAPGRKVIFLAGGAGSGKSNVVKQLGLQEQGFKIVNQDISLEWLSKNHGLPTNMKDFTPEQASKWGSLQWEARDIAQRKQMKFQGKGDGIIVDGTGASEISMSTQVMKFRNKGYDVQMIFVETSLPVALARNKARKERSLKNSIVERNHKAVMANKKAFKEDFGDNFAEVNTDNLKQGDLMPKNLINKLDKFTKGYIKGRLIAGEFASKGDMLLEQGAEFDFSEFNKVVDGTPGPLLDKAKNRAAKYGTKDMFVLTARPQASAWAIQNFLRSQGLNIPLKNITGLAKSTGDAKAQWVLNKFAEGYNDIYFVDDAIQNVKAVKEVLDQLDIKSKVVQAKIKFSKNANKEFNTIIEESQGTKADKIISQAEAKKIGRHKGWWRIFVPASAEDFKGLMYRFLGKGRQGDRHMAWFKDHLFDPFAKGIRSWNNYKQGMVNEYKALKKEFKDINKSLKKKVKGTDFSAEQAVRVYLWDKAGFEIPGLNNDTKTKLINHVLGNTRLQKFADVLSQITRTKEGYIKPRQGWSIGVIANDLNDIVNRVGRKQFLQDWIENKNAIFTPDNMNKIEALYGTGFRNALENILDRMEHGGNRRVSPDKNVNMLLDWINGSVGAIMFFNMRSALLQTISTVNFINMSDNNIFKAGAAFANQKQFWTDFAMLFNSPQLKQRRAGIQIDVSASELTKAFSTRGFTPAAAISWLLEKGFTPTQIADSFAIAFGGASFYRNRYKKYIKEGISPKEANERAMLDFQEISEETQQSSREDLISQQQASVLGRIVLAFQNVTMQMTRKTKKHLSDLSNRRSIPGYTQSQSDMANVSGIMYYGVVQSIIFLSLQSALAAYIWGDDEEEIDKKTGKVINGSLDSFLSGMGLHGIIAKTIKNTIAVYKEEKEKGWNREDGKILLEIMNFSPPIGSKLRKIWNAIKTEQYNKGVSEELGWRIENPDLYWWASIIEAATNIPTQRLIKKANNLEEAITGNHMMWQRIMLALGWSGWTIGVEDEELEAAKEAVKEKKVEEKKIIKEEKKEQEKIEKEEEKKKEEEEKKKKGIKTVRCSGISSSGNRCGNTTETAAETWKCYHHMEFTDGMDRDNDGIKEYRCTATKTDGNRCKNKTENTSKKCYAHQ